MGVCGYFFPNFLTIGAEHVGLQNHSGVGVQNLDEVAAVEEQEHVELRMIQDVAHLAGSAR